MKIKKRIPEFSTVEYYYIGLNMLYYQSQNSPPCMSVSKCHVNIKYYQSNQNNVNIKYYQVNEYHIIMKNYHIISINVILILLRYHINILNNIKIKTNKL